MVWCMTSITCFCHMPSHNAAAALPRCRSRSTLLPLHMQCFPAYMGP